MSVKLVPSIVSLTGGISGCSTMVVPIVGHSTQALWSRSLRFECDCCTLGLDCEAYADVIVTVDIVPWWVPCHGGHCAVVYAMPRWTLCHGGCHVTVDIVP